MLVVFVFWCVVCLFFVFKQKTAYEMRISDWSSDVCSSDLDLAGDPYRTAHAARMLGHALDCGFTTVRDIGGGDWSLLRAIEDRLLRAPRFFYAGKILSMTGGHGDLRQIGESQPNPRYF